MQTPNYYISEYYIKNTVLSFLGLVVISGIFRLMVDHIPQSYESVGVLSAITFMIIATTTIGYFNTSTTSR